ncbi:MAG: hypothetical protein WAZ20_07340, partial [Methanothrix sp.]
GQRESALRASRGSALAPSAPGWLGYNRGDPLIVSDISELIFSSRARLNCELSLQFEPLALFLHRQRHIHHLATCHSWLWVATATTPSRRS